MLTLTFIIHLALWVLGFVFLFRIPYCTSVRSKIAHYPRISVIIPARNEETTLPNLLASLKRQTLPPDEVIVIDDQSEDRTKEIAEREGTVVVESKPLPKGWIGKAWACSQGAKVATGDVFIFLDADTILEEGGLKSITDTYIQRDGVISIQPYHRIQKLYEQFSAFFNIVVMGAMQTFTILGDMIKPIGLFGPAIVLKKQYYLESGGHEKVKGKLLEDLAFATQFKEKNIGTYCYGGKNTISFRMYPNGIMELINGWSKGFALGATKTSIPMLIIIIAWIVGAMGTTRHLAQTIPSADTVSIVLWAFLYVCYVLQIYWMLFRIGNFKFYTALFYPIPLLFFIIVFAYSFTLIFLRKSVKWKARTIDVKGRISK